MTTPIREYVLAAIATRLEAQLPSATIERAMRTEPDPAEFPLLVLTGGDMVPDETMSPGECFWTIAFTVHGHARGADDLAAEQALSALHAAVVAALQGHEIGGYAVQLDSGATTLELYDAEVMETPCGVFTAGFSVLAVTPLGSPYAA